MRNVFKYLPQVSARRAEAPGSWLLLDFDGTLSPLAKTPSRAMLPKISKNILKKISRCIPVAIISGRSLKDIKRKVGIVGLTYAGNHGLEWETRGARRSVALPSGMKPALTAARARWATLARSFPGALVENKKLIIALHYRLVKKHLIKKLLTEARQAAAPFQKKHLLKLTAGKKVLEARPAVAWSKGRWVEFFLRQSKKPAAPIYIGDDVTDEDVFKILTHGLTIRVGRAQQSRANYYCRGTQELRLFLRWLLKEEGKTKNRPA